MRFRTVRMRAKQLSLLLGLGVVCQFGGCDIGTISATTSVTLDGREAIIQLVRGAILTPIDAFITNAVNEMFDADED